MLRAAVLFPFLRGLQCFDTTSRLAAPFTSKVASWQLPHLDLQRLADDDFSGRTNLWHSRPTYNRRIFHQIRDQVWGLAYLANPSERFNQANDET
jgi:hypothetical protein